MNYFKFRAECLHDVSEFLEKFTPSKGAIYFEMEKDVECIIETVAQIDEVIAYMNLVPDSHVMIETIKPINEYTGIREK